jgi:hypothetical protein
MGDAASCLPRSAVPQRMVSRCRRTDAVMSQYVIRARAVLECFGATWAIEYMHFNKIPAPLQERVLLITARFRGD